MIGVILREGDAGFAFAQRGENILGAVADRGHDAKTGDDDAAHRVASVAMGFAFRVPGAVQASPNSPTRMSDVV